MAAERFVTEGMFEERYKGIVAVCKERHKGIEDDVSCLHAKIKEKAGQKEVDELKETVKGKAEKSSVRSIQGLQILTFMAIIGQFLYVIFAR